MSSPHSTLTADSSADEVRAELTPAQHHFKLAYDSSGAPSYIEGMPFQPSPNEGYIWVDSFDEAEILFLWPAQLDQAAASYPKAKKICLCDATGDEWPRQADEIIEWGAPRQARERLWRRLRMQRASEHAQRALIASERRVAALKVASQALSELHDEREILARLVEVVAEQLRSERVSVLQVIAERHELQMIAARGIPPEIIAQARPKIGEGIAGRCAALAQPIFVSNHQRYRDQSGGQVSGDEALDGGEAPMSLTVPILVKGEVVGVVNVTGRADHQPYSGAEIAFLSALMSHAGYLMESTQLIDRLRALQSFSEQVINTLSDPLAVVNREGTLLKVNPRFGEVFGELSNSSSDAATGPKLSAHLAGALGELDDELHSHIERGEGVSLPNIRYQGQTFDARLTPFDDNDPRMLLILHDVTERQNMGKQLLSAEKMASLGILAAGVAHEINNPLGFVKTNTKEAGRYFEDLFEIIDAWESFGRERGVGAQAAPLRVSSDIGLGEVREDVPNLVRESLEGIERIQKITASLKSFAHPDTENTREAQLATLVENALVITQSKWRHTLTITRDLPEHGPLSCIPSQLEQVFMNLVVNAAQAAKSRGESSTMEIKLVEPPHKASREVTICFIDQCGGIPEEVVERIFDPFFTTKDIGEGTGLGLHIAHNIIEGHGGTIVVESDPPRGTTFRITLPLGVKRGPLVIKQLSRFKA